MTLVYQIQYLIFRWFCGCHAGLWRRRRPLWSRKRDLWFDFTGPHASWKGRFPCLERIAWKGVTTPVLIMTAKESLDDKGHGFELGADDYLTKPFYLEELKMRIQALLKRSGKVNENTLNYGNLKGQLIYQFDLCGWERSGTSWEGIWSFGLFPSKPKCHPSKDPDLRSSLGIW